MSDESVNNGLRLFDEKKKLPYLFIHLFIYLFFLNAYIIVVHIASVNWGTDTDLFLITL